MNIDKKELLKELDKIPKFKGLGVILVKRDSASKLRDPVYTGGHTKYIIVDLDADSQKARKAESNTWDKVREAGSAAIACTGAALAVSADKASTAAVGPSYGFSLLLKSITYPAMVATSAQCGNGLARTYWEFTNPSINDTLDNSDLYQNFTNTIDIVSVAGAAVSAGTAARLFGILKKSGVRISPAAKGQVSRQARARFAKQLEKSRHNNLSNKQWKKMVREKRAAKRFSSDTIRHETRAKIADAVSASLGMGSSATSGKLSSVAVYILEEEQ